MYKVTFYPGFFRGDFEREASNAALEIMLDCLVRLDVLYLSQYPDTPPLYQAGVRYKREGLREENWLAIPHVLKQKHGDCEDLASWRTAELQRQGIAARPMFTWAKLPNGGTLYHIKVQHPNGQIEDPSRILGMKSKVEL